MMSINEVPTIEPPYRSVSYVETKAKGSALQWFILGLAMYVSYSVGVTAGKSDNEPIVMVGYNGTVWVNGKIVSDCRTDADDGFKCEAVSH